MSDWVIQPDRTFSQRCVTQLTEALQSSELLIELRRIAAGGDREWFIVHDRAQLAHFLEATPRPGDSIQVWRIQDCCTNENVFLGGQFPDAQGRIHGSPAY